MSADSDHTPSIDDIYRELQRGAGHQWVHDGNVQALIDMAVTRRHRLIEVQLREWRASCAPSEEDEEALDPHPPLDGGAKPMGDNARPRH
ncbi:MAG: hypothetical protein QM742_19120 [Aquabacterium sp.]